MGEKRRRCHDDDDLHLPHPPEDVLIQILGRLPVKSLGQYKSVCKSWLGLITSSFVIDLDTSTTFKFGAFILQVLLYRYSPKKLKSSREHSIISISSQSLLLRSSESESGHGWRWWKSTGSDDDPDASHCEEQVFKVDNNNSSGGSNDQQQQQLLVLKLDRLGVPSVYDPCKFFFKLHVVGSCNGIVCLYDRDSNNACLWNPATSKRRILPKPEKINENYPARFAAFGFDVKTKDYKVLLLTGYKSMHYKTRSPVERLCRVQVYSLSTDSWKLVEGITCLPGDPFIFTEHALYVNGSCFFMAHCFATKQLPCFPESDRFVISFDFTNETITLVQLPDHNRGEELYLTSLGDKKIALFITKCHHNGGYEDYNVWELKEQYISSSSSVNKKAWTKLHSFQIQVEIPDENNIPRGISDDGEFALLETNTDGLGKKMKLYHIVSQEMKMNFLTCSSMTSNAFRYKLSRVSIKGGNSRRR